MSKVLIITITAIVIIALGATAIYITQRQEGREVKEQPVEAIAEKPVVQPPGPPPVSEPRPTTEPKIDTSDWKTYRNEEYGFEVKYPKNWYYTGSKEKNQRVICFNPFGEVGDCTGLIIVSWGTTLQKKYMELKQFLEKEHAVIESIVFIGGTEGRLLEVKDTIGFSRAIFFEKEGYVYNFSIVAGEESIFEKMVSTFRFIR